METVKISDVRQRIFQHKSLFTSGLTRFLKTDGFSYHLIATQGSVLSDHGQSKCAVIVDHECWPDLYTASALHPE
jgi:hypothetical protein